MALKPYQQTIALATLYEIEMLGGVSGMGAQLKPSIETIGGVVDIYVAQTEPTSEPTGMSVINNGNDFVGNAYFDYIPRYLYIAQVSGTTTSIVLTGIKATAVA